MQTPQQNDNKPLVDLRRVTIFIGGLLLLVSGWLWIRYSGSENKSALVSEAQVPDTLLDSALKRKEGDSVLASTPRVDKKVLKATAPTRPPVLKPRPQPADIAPVNVPSNPPPKPAPAACDQLVLRNGDLVDAKITEIGVNEVRYKRCRLQDGPDYVVPRSEVLSIRYANGEIERL